MSDSNRKQGMSGFSLLGLIFIVLKLTGTISWSWWWVTAPFWGGFAILLAILIIFALVAAIIALLE